MPRVHVGLDADPWLLNQPKKNMPSHAQMHALGCVTYNWNLCEEHMFALFGILTRIPLRTRYTVLQGMGDVTMVEKLRSMPKKMRFGPPLTDAIVHACDLYDVTRQNRNALLHASWVPKRNGGHFAALHKKTGSTLVVAEGVDTIRQVVSDAGVCAAYILRIIDFMVDANPTPRHRRSLPEKPPVPEKIVKPPQTVGPKRPRQPPPSRG